LARSRLAFEQRLVDFSFKAAQGFNFVMESTISTKLKNLKNEQYTRTHPSLYNHRPGLLPILVDYCAGGFLFSL